MAEFELTALVKAIFAGMSTFIVVVGVFALIYCIYLLIKAVRSNDR